MTPPRDQTVDRDDEITAVETTPRTRTGEIPRLSPATTDVLAEVQVRLGQAPPPPSSTQRLVALLLERGFAVQTDSHDPIRHVEITSSPTALTAEAERLLDLLRGEGVIVGAIDRGSASILASYDPAGGTATILLCGVRDTDLAAVST